MSTYPGRIGHLHQNLDLLVVANGNGVDDVLEVVVRRFFVLIDGLHHQLDQLLSGGVVLVDDQLTVGQTDGHQENACEE